MDQEMKEVERSGESIGRRRERKVNLDASSLVSSFVLKHQNLVHQHSTLSHSPHHHQQNPDYIPLHSINHLPHSLLLLLFTPTPSPYPSNSPPLLHLPPVLVPPQLDPSEVPSTIS